MKTFFALFAFVLARRIEAALDASSKAPIQIAFGVMTYQKPGLSVELVLDSFHRLMDTIYSSKDHLYILHVDTKSETGLLDSIYGEYCDDDGRTHNCGYIRPRNVGWAGLSTGEMMLGLMQAAIEYPITDYVHNHAHGSSNYEKKESLKWDYFVLIGHESVPMFTLPYIELFLASSKSNLYPPKTNFVNCWNTGGYDFFGQWEDVNFRLQTLVVDSMSGFLIEDLAWHNRKTGAFHKAERAIPRPSDMTIYKSIQLVVLHREACEYLVYGPDTKLVMLYLANVKTSDEMLIPTLIQKNDSLALSTTCDTTLHFTHWIRPGGSWHPEYLTMEHLPMLMNTTKHLFMRKMHPVLSKTLLHAMDELKQLNYENIVRVTNRLIESDSCSSDSDSICDNKKKKSNNTAILEINENMIPLLQQPDLIRQSMSSSLKYDIMNHIFLVSQGEIHPHDENKKREQEQDQQYEQEYEYESDGELQLEATKILISLFPDLLVLVARENSEFSLPSSFVINWKNQAVELDQIDPLTCLMQLDRLRKRRDEIESRIFFDDLKRYHAAK